MFPIVAVVTCKLFVEETAIVDDKEVFWMMFVDPVVFMLVLADVTTK